MSGMRTAVKKGRFEGNYDVVVAGGGLSGVCAAIAAARLGCKVALVQDRPVLGGNSSSEIRVGIGGADHDFRNARETGILEELRMEVYARGYKEGTSTWDTVLWETVQKESNITLFLNAAVTGAKVSEDGSRIVAAKAWQTTTERELRLKAEIFVDASGDGRMAAEAGADFRIGREAREEFGESLAPEAADHYTLGTSLLYTAKDTGHPVEFKAPEWAYKYSSCEELPHRNHSGYSEQSKSYRFQSGFWWIELGGTMDTIEDSEVIRFELLKHLLGLWDHIKNHPAHREKARNYALDWIAAVPGKRESRRFIGDYILNQKDLDNCRRFKDQVAYGGWPIDLHVPDGIRSPEPPGINRYLPSMYSIPFRSLYSRNIDNLMMAGRNISASHVALGSTRLMATCALMGQAAGTAAYLRVKYHLTPREIGKKHIEDLQQSLLRQGCYLICLPNKDPDDLALHAKATASSERMLKVTDAEEEYKLNVERGLLFPVTAGRIKRIELLLSSRVEGDEELSVRLRKARHLTDFSSVEDIAVAKANVPQGERQWVAFEFDVNVPSGLYWIHVSKNEKISWWACKGNVVGVQRTFLSNGKWAFRRIRNGHCFRISPESTSFGAENVVNGFNRPEDMPNLWASNPHQELPQWIELDFGGKRKLGRLILTFDTNVDLQHPLYWVYKECFPACECVKDYRILGYDGASWMKLVEEKGNYQRRREHKIHQVNVSKIRLEVLTTNGSPDARVFEIRAYE